MHHRLSTYSGRRFLLLGLGQGHSTISLVWALPDYLLKSIHGHPRRSQTFVLHSRRLLAINTIPTKPKRTTSMAPSLMSSIQSTQTLMSTMIQLKGRKQLRKAMRSRAPKSTTKNTANALFAVDSMTNGTLLAMLVRTTLCINASCARRSTTGKIFSQGTTNHMTVVPTPIATRYSKRG